MKEFQRAFLEWYRSPNLLLSEIRETHKIMNALAEGWVKEHGPIITSRKESTMSEKFIIKDSGVRKEFNSGMVRDTSEGKIDYHRMFDGPLWRRYAIHLTKGATKYPDVTPGVPNWTLANGHEELERFKQSAIRHFIQALVLEDSDEDHFAAAAFNMNGYLYVKENLEKSRTKESL